MSEVIDKVGRKLRLGVIGGGLNSFIGSVHRGGALLTECYEIVASVLSSDADRSIQSARSLGIPRGYGAVGDLIAQEALRDDKIDVLAIMTPNDSHYEIACQALEAGFHVICEKPLTNVLSEAYELEARVRKCRKLFCVAYGYAGYPMVRQARAMVASGDLGDIRMVQCNYVQGHLAAISDAERAGSNWHMHPDIAGPDLIVADIGTHCYHLSSFVTGMLPAQLSADTCTLVPERHATDYTSIQLRYANGARGNFWITQAATGAEHGLYLRVFGSKGGLEWHQEHPNELLWRRLEQPAMLLTKGGPGLYQAAERVSRVPIGHPEGYSEGFASLYAEFGRAVAHALTDDTIPVDSQVYFPTIAEGVQGVRFVETAIESNRANGAWTDLHPRPIFSAY